MVTNSYNSSLFVYDPLRVRFSIYVFKCSLLERTILGPKLLPIKKYKPFHQYYFAFINHILRGGARKHKQVMEMTMVARSFLIYVTIYRLRP